LLHLIPDDERLAWIEPGLGPEDWRLAEQLPRFGITPADLQIRVDGTKLGARLRGGESVGSVAARLAEYRQRERA
jgi:hypothetical protein